MTAGSARFHNSTEEDGVARVVVISLSLSEEVLFIRVGGERQHLSWPNPGSLQGCWRLSETPRLAELQKKSVSP